MIIDSHVHVYPPSFRERREELSRRDATFRALYADPRAVPATADDLLAAMDEAGVDVAVAVGIGWTDPEVAREANDYLVESTARSGGRLLAFGSVNPAWGDDALAEVERCAAAGLIGIGELHPDTQGYGIDNASVMAPLMALAKRLGMPVLTHASEPVGHSYPGKGTVTPDRLMRFIEAFPRAAGDRGALGRRAAFLRPHAGGEGLPRRTFTSTPRRRRSSTRRTCSRAQPASSARNGCSSAPTSPSSSTPDCWRRCGRAASQHEAQERSLPAATRPSCFGLGG